MNFFVNNWIAGWLNGLGRIALLVKDNRPAATRYNAGVPAHTLIVLPPIVKCLDVTPIQPRFSRGLLFSA